MFIPVQIVRGGSSKGLVVHRDALPPPGEARDAVILRLFGSPDRRQIDGLGGADKLTSKLAVIGAPSLEGCDIDYHFAQVGIADPLVDWSANCGNIAAAVALIGAQQGVGVRTAEGMARVVIHKVNVGRRLIADVPMDGDQPARAGDFAIGGVPGTGPRIDLDFADLAGCMLDRGLFPTGVLRETVALASGERLPVSILDLANLHGVVLDSDIGLDLSAPSGDLDARTEIVARLEALRVAVARQSGLYAGEDVAAATATRNNPLIHVVSTGRPGGAVDIEARSFTRGTFSKAFPVSGAFACAAAARVSGTILASVPHAQPAAGSTSYAIRHATGIVRCDVAIADRSAGSEVLSARMGRTARILMSGEAILEPSSEASAK